ncbi:YcxB family protein [Flagellimonas sp. 389]|uniref:YcxB family protein n=1 Tax=Flagellimonas sp. 389 TaxID=2835862 RepID=UPI001BD68561|nr:YcxB family protein [Flagellimonas sp. 389]MBS9461321.1 YcxB family protein [Flagellimonas sp. 389]
MNVTYILDRDDYLQYQLYYASTTKSIKAMRLKAWLAVFFVFVFFGCLLALYTDGFIIYSFAATATIMFVLFPFYHKNRLKKQYRRHIEENYKNSFEKETKLQLNEHNFQISSATGESRINHSSLDKIIEISSHYFLKIKSGTYLIIPKTKIEDAKDIRAALKKLSEKLKVEYSEELNWKWN